MKPNILFIVIDGFRADKFYGDNKTSKTPNIDSLIKRGIYFNQAISSSDGTVTSLGTVFTSLYSFQSGITTFTSFSKAIRYFDILKNYGYYTYATVQDHIFFHKLASNFDGKSTFPKPYTNLFDGTGQKIIERLESNPKEPWIYYIHIMDLHRSVKFAIPDEFNNEQYGNNEYEKMVSAIDYWIGKILQKVDLDKTLLVLTADHGDFIPISTIGHEINYIPTLVEKSRAIKQHTPKFLEPIGFRIFLLLRKIITPIRAAKLKKTLSPDEMRTLNIRGHKSMWDLYDEIFRIPLLFAGYGVTSSMVISQQVRQIDIFPTVAELIGLVSTEKVQGQSLVPLFSGRKLDEQPAYVENIAVNPKQLGNVIGLRTPEYKYYRSRTDPAKNITLFDLKNDPQEKNNIASTRQDIVEKMEKTLKQILTESFVKDEQVQMTQEETKKVEHELRKLGYI